VGQARATVGAGVDRVYRALTDIGVGKRWGLSRAEAAFDLSGFQGSAERCVSITETTGGGRRE
jgi:hypothetical protein